MNKLEQAIELAGTAHQGQTDKGGQPYILHPLRVMAAVEGDSEKIAAVLHDVAEDCPDYPLYALRERFGLKVGDALNALTKRQGETYEQFVARCAEHPIAATVKIADIQDNSNVKRFGRELMDEDLARLQKYQRASLYLETGKWLDC